MYKKLKFVILIITILGIGLGIFSFINLVDKGIKTEFYFPTIILGLIVIFYLLPKDFKVKNTILTYVIFGFSLLFLFITLNLTLTHFSLQRFQKTMTEYHELDCAQMNTRFATDLKQNNLKYFSSGLFGSGNLSKYLKDYKIENYDLGCLVYNNLNCYNDLVEQHLYEKENIKIIQLYN